MINRIEGSRSSDYGDLIIGSNHERLQGVEIVHSYGTDVRKKGWETYIDKDTRDEVMIPETIDSSKTPFEPLVLLVPPEMIGTHEATDPDYIPREGEDMRGFGGISFESGWFGSPIAVAAFCTCQGNEVIQNDIYQSIYQALSKNGGIGVLSELKFGDLGVLDGHHRRRMSAEGMIRLKYVPVQLIPYLIDESVILDTWHNDGNVWTAEKVFECFKTPDKYADAKRTKFGVRGTDGIIRRILDTQPSIYIPLENLI